MRTKFLIPKNQNIFQALSPPSCFTTGNSFFPQLLDHQTQRFLILIHLQMTLYQTDEFLSKMGFAKSRRGYLRFH